MFTGMRKIVATALAVLIAQPAAAQSDRFAPGNPWYGQFEEVCRQDDPGDPMDAECQKGVEAAWRDISKSPNVDCDYGAFWLVSDEMKRLAPQTFPVLPWQTGVEHVLREGGVCRVVAP
jgi:hypothetical protein